MFTSILFFIIVLFSSPLVQCDLTNVNDFFSLLKQNSSITRQIGFLSKANYEVVKRYLTSNVKNVYFTNKTQMLEAIDNETIIAGITTSRFAEDLEPKYHVFSSLIVSPQAMLLAPDYNPIITPYGLQNTSSNDLFDALNAAIAEVQHEDIDETLLTNNSLTNIIRAYTCRQDSQLPVVNRDNATGYLRDILLKTKVLQIGGLGPFDWGVHDGNYQSKSPGGFYPQLLQAIVTKLGQIKGKDEMAYGQGLTFNRTYYQNATQLFEALLKGDIHATDVYLLIDAPYTGTGILCSEDSQCRARETCLNKACTHPPRSRSLHFRTTCTTASRDTKFITKKTNAPDSGINQTTTPYQITTPSQTTTRLTPKTRYIGFILVFVALFGTIFLALLILIRRKKNYRIEHTLQGGFGKFARLQEESELPVEAMDSFEDQIVQSPRDNTNSTT